MCKGVESFARALTSTGPFVHNASVIITGTGTAQESMPSARFSRSEWNDSWRSAAGARFIVQGITVDQRFGNAILSA